MEGGLAKWLGAKRPAPTSDSLRLKSSRSSSASARGATGKKRRADNVAGTLSSARLPRSWEGPGLRGPNLGDCPSVGPTSKWGALVDASWAAEFQGASAEERSVQWALRKVCQMRERPYSPCFRRRGGATEQALRSPGSGVFRLDHLRFQQWSSTFIPADGSVRELSHVNLACTLKAFEKHQKAWLDGYLEPKLDELLSTVSEVLGVGTSTLQFKILASLFFSTTWWCTTCALLSKWLPQSDDKTIFETLKILRLKGLVVTAPQTKLDALELFRSLSHDDLSKSATLRSSARGPKRNLLCFLSTQNRNEIEDILGEINISCARLDRHTWDALHKVMICTFAMQGYSAEDTRAFLTKVNLSTIRFPLHITCAKEVSSMEQKGSENEDEAMLQRLASFEHREQTLAAHALLAEMEGNIVNGDEDGALRTLHRATSEMAHMRETNGDLTGLQLDTLSLLARIALCGCNLLEREKRFEDALHYLRFVIRATENLDETLLLHCEALQRYARNQEHRKNRDGALSAVENLLRKKNAVLGATLFPASKTPNRLGELGVSLLKTCKKLSVPPWRWKLAIPEAESLCDPPTLTIEGVKESVPDPKAPGGFSRRWVGGQSVEQVVLSHFEKEQWQGQHCENGIALTLFMLLMWDSIFAAPKRETAPIAFLELPESVRDGTWLKMDAIRVEVQSRLNDILKGGLQGVSAKLSSSWDKHFGTHARGVNWARNPKDEMLLIASALGPTVIAMICSLYAEHYAAWNGGLPDLLLWRQHPVPSARFVEVKGPGDSLSNGQRAWIDKLQAAGADICVCHVVVAQD
mmetsp:Transcript_39/g.53  ORF Transcript_39/g.53 Transcript_39/m.53 type:complete len:809 (+) Transcript_39:305-2731(+)